MLPRARTARTTRTPAAARTHTCSALAPPPQVRFPPARGGASRPHPPWRAVLCAGGRLAGALRSAHKPPPRSPGTGRASLSASLTPTPARRPLAGTRLRVTAHSAHTPGPPAPRPPGCPKKRPRPAAWAPLLPAEGARPGGARGRARAGGGGRPASFPVGAWLMEEASMDLICS